MRRSRALIAASFMLIAAAMSPELAEASQAFVTLPDGSVTTLKRLTAGGRSSSHPLQFTNGRLTFFLDDAATATIRVTFARGRMARLPCTLQK